MIKKALITGSLFFMLTSLSSYTFIFCKRQGIKGHVFLVKGNQMPSPDVKPASPKPIQTTVYVYELTNTSQVKQVPQSSFYSAINTRLIKQVIPDKNGNFKINLDPGKYSLFIKKDDLFYANLYDEKNNIFPVTVEKKKFTQIDIKADYDAVY
jgi:hypothetical protein